LLFRTLLFIPGNNERFVNKSFSLESDILCYDLEDSVPLNEKALARNLIRTKFAEARVGNHESSLFVRVNSISSGVVKIDLSEVIQPGIDGIVLPKINDSTELLEVSQIVQQLEKERNLESGKIALIPSIETARGVVNTFSIARSDDRVVAVVFGVFDFLHDMDIEEITDANSYSYARSKIAIDAKAAGVSSLDGIWQDVHDIQGLITDATTARKLGFSGKTLIHPSHIEPVRQVFLPTPSQVIWAKKVIAALSESMERGTGSGAVKLDGKMIDAVHYKQAKSLLEMTKQSNKEK
jgi:citrate lyase subunit beta / citryl-CoA lyase